MPNYRFVTNNGGAHQVEVELPDDGAARKEAREAFADAARDALVDSDSLEMTMNVETEGRVIYRARLAFSVRDQTE